jgi:hypothetical protein
MIESAYALRKYLEAVAKVFPADELERMEVECNVETITAIAEFDNMLQLPNISLLDGVVVERVDLCRSNAMSDDDINSEYINRLVSEVCTKAKSKKLVTTIAGGVSAESIDFIKTIRGSLDRYETRKVCFDAAVALCKNPEKGILKALAFEILWLHNKSDFYKAITDGDKSRIRLLEGHYVKDMDLL